jgi:hypothetical protein
MKYPIMDERLAGYVNDRRLFHYAMSMEMCQIINVLQAASEMGVSSTDCRGWIQSQTISCNEV